MHKTSIVLAAFALVATGTIAASAATPSVSSTAAQTMTVAQ